MPIFYVYMQNNTDRQDDKVVKLIAKSSKQAKTFAKGRDPRDNFTVDEAYRAKDFSRRLPFRDWYALLKDQPAETG